MRHYKVFDHIDMRDVVVIARVFLMLLRWHLHHY